MSLNLLGADNIINLTEDSTAANLCNLYWDTVRDNLLAEHPWQFAQDRVALTEETSLEDELEEWDYIYSYPSNYLEFQRLTDETAKWERIGNYIYTNEEDAEGIVTVRIEDTGLWSRPFVTAMQWALAREIAYKITNDRQLADLIEKRAEEKIRKAKSDDAREKNTSIKGSDDDTDTWLSVR